MADPATWALILSAAAAGTSAVGARNQGIAQKQAAEYQAAVAQNNAVISEQNADLELRRGAIEEQKQREKTAQLIGAQRAGFGASGVDVAAGTPLRVQSDTAEVGEVDALTVRNNAMRQAYGYRLQAQNFESEAAFESVAGRNAKRAGDLEAFGSLVSGASSTSSKYASFKQSGAIK